MTKKIIFILWCAICLIPAQGQIVDLSRYVNPFIGTAEGQPELHTKDNAYINPGAVLPWGLMSVSPFNLYDGTDQWRQRPSPYIHGKKYISGFTHVNMSGTGCYELGTCCLMPTVGDFSPQRIDYSEYSDEKASPGYYSVQLDKYNIRAELTTTLRTAISKFTFPEGRSNIILNMGLGLTSQKGAVIRRISDTEVEGYKMLGGFCGMTSIHIIYFYAQLSKSPAKCGVWLNGRFYEHYQREMAGDDVGACFTFDTKKDEVIYVKVGVSYVSAENARDNVRTEMPTFDFEHTREAARQAWNKELSKIIVEGGTEDDKVKFYTALFHTLIHPNIFHDANGDYQKFGSVEKGIIQGFDRYTLFSLWDTYRNVHPFLSLVYPKQQSDMVKSLLAISDENGFLPRWDLAGLETNTMVGDPALPVIVDAWFRGIRDFDVHKAYQAMKRNAITPEKDNYMRPGMEGWLRYGYIPEDVSKMQLRHVWGSVSTGLEYCIADWNLSQLAKSLGYDDDYKLFYNRSMTYRNYYDSVTGLMRPRFMDGQWITPFNQESETGFTEGSAWNYTFMVPHDIPGLINLMGGTANFVSKLNTCFEKAYFDVTNEPDIAYPYLYNYVKGQEWRTQKQVRDIVNTKFTNSINGLPGNDDCGTMSAWLMFSMMGFYPACPGDMIYQLSSPVFDKVTIHLDPAYYPGGAFVIEAKNAGENNCYVKKIELNGKNHASYTIHHNDIVKGGKLRFTLSAVAAINPVAAHRMISDFNEMDTPSPAPYKMEAIAPYDDHTESVSQATTLARQLGLTTVDWTVLHAGVWHLWQWDYDNYGKIDYADARPVNGKDNWDKRAAAEAFDKHATILPNDDGIVGTTFRRTQALLEHLKNASAVVAPHSGTAAFASNPGTAAKLAACEADLEKLRQSWSKIREKNSASEKSHYYTLCALRRQIAFANPLLDFDDVLVAARGTFTGSVRSLPATNDGVGGHMANQYFGFNTIPGGGLFVFKNWRGIPEVHDLLQDAVVENGRLQGRNLHHGSVATPDLSFDGKKIAFAWSGNQAHNLNRYALDNTFHIFTINTDGTDLRQLTDGTEGDFDPCFLPNGRIAFVSERRGGFIRCFNSNLRVRNYTLFSMKDDGSDIAPMSYFETSEWNPSVNNDGMLVYSRWDYVDRENCIGARFWISGPDGSNPLAPHGNYPHPYSTIGAPENVRREFEKQYADVPFSGLGSRWGTPLVQMGIRAIPGSHRYVFTAAPHHGQAYGSLGIMDLREKDDGYVSQVRRLTPDEPYPETESGIRRHYKYGMPWPLSEDFFLANMWEDVVLLDRFGNHEFLCGVRELPCFPDEKLRLVDPIVLRARKTPPNLPPRTCQGEKTSTAASKATIFVVNVYDTDLPLPADIKIKWLRVVQNILKTNHTMGLPMVGHENESTPRIPLGLVPVEEDGSVYFEAPVAKELIFQLLDEDYRAVHSMRSVAFVHPGEQLSCIGCHAPDNRAPASAGIPRALRRVPSKLKPELEPIEPISYYRQIKPIVDNKCMACHRTNSKGPQDLSYESFKDDNIWFSGGMLATMVGDYSGEHGGSRTIPGTFGARSSKVGAALMNANHREVVDEKTRHTIITWLDCNTLRLGAFEREAEQLQGALVWPALDVDPANPQGVDGTFPSLKHHFWHENNYGPYAFVGSCHEPGMVFIMNGDGGIVWNYPAQNPQDVWMLPNGNVLFASLHAVREVTRQKQVVWEYTVQAPNETPTCQPLHDGHVLVGIVGECRLLELDRTGKIVHEIKLKTTAERPHQQFRHCRKTPENTYLVPFTDEGAVREYNAKGEIVRQFPHMQSPICAVRLPNGNTLITADSTVTEYDANNKIIWQLNNAFDIPDFAIGVPAGVQRLPNGNTVVCNWLPTSEEGKINAHIFELTTDKRVVWKVVTDKIGAVASCRLLTEDLSVNRATTLY